MHFVCVFTYITFAKLSVKEKSPKSATVTKYKRKTVSDDNNQGWNIIRELYGYPSQWSWSNSNPCVYSMQTNNQEHEKFRRYCTFPLLKIASSIEGFSCSGNVTDQEGNWHRKYLNILMSYRIYFKLPKVINSIESILVWVLVLAKLFQILYDSWYCFSSSYKMLKIPSVFGSFWYASLRCWNLSKKKLYSLHWRQCTAHPSLLTVKNTFSTWLSIS